MSTDPWATIANAKWDQTKASLHDYDAHKIDRLSYGGDVRWPTCSRCKALCITFHHEHGIAHLLPVGYEQENQL